MITIKRGSNGDEVFILQRLLNKIGYNLTQDGDFGLKSHEAVIKFQRANGLSGDGVVGERTWNKVFDKTFTPGEVVYGTDVFHHELADMTPAFWAEIESKYYYCFCKASEGVNYNDPEFLNIMNLLKQRRILRGGYHFFRMLNEDITGQINNFLDSGVDYREKGILPPVLDVEPAGSEWLNPSLLTQERVAIVQRMRKWLQVVEQKTGKKPIIYTSKNIWDNILKAPTGFENYPLWLASYSGDAKLPMTWTKYYIWQYSEKGKIGDRGEFDLNRLHPSVGYKDLLKMAGY